MSTNSAPNQSQRREIAEPYAILTRDVGGGISAPSPDGSSGARGGGLGPVVTKALQDVLGWKINSGDSKGFVSALNQCFVLTQFEGVVQAKWTPPRSFAVQNDLAGGISGAQASIYTMAKTILDQALPLVAGLRPLKPDADAEYTAVLQQLAQNQLTELVAELGMLGGPRVVRVNQYFRMLIGADVNIDGQGSATKVVVDPDLVSGTLGNLRDEMGLRATKSNSGPGLSYVNSVSDEADVTNFRVVVDYVNAILNSWINSIQFFMTMQTPFLGTQLVWISRQLGVVNEAIEEVRFLLDSVFVGAAERETLWLTGLVDDQALRLPDITLEALLSWIQTFVTSEGPDIIQAGGKLAIGEDFEQMVGQLQRYTQALSGYAQASGGPFGTERVLVGLQKLSRQLDRLSQMALSVGVTEPPDSPAPPIQPAPVIPAQQNVAATSTTKRTKKAGTRAP
jgi:hypothetical protein